MSVMSYRSYVKERIDVPDGQMEPICPFSGTNMIICDFAYTGHCYFCIESARGYIRQLVKKLKIRE